ncbi:ankyrin repeat domain-containing protein [unidentified bacterial endosymbiont]|uniref:ankyrin repeat domain-containing protein n=1 Tax=unidentified bacterial endosymbiont TaxID=2355 RepID=UPI00209C8A24|nr:ankyrin repeat domain-containing protein [unidentified bacterial endosymbiont]
MIDEIRDSITENKLHDLQQTIDLYPKHLTKPKTNPLGLSEQTVRIKFINIQDSDNGNTMLHHAIIEKKMSILNYLVTLDGINGNLPNKSEETPLMLAVRNNYVDAARSLFTIDNLNVNLRDNDAQTPLLRAASNGSIELCNLLFEHAATKIHLKDRSGKSALDYLFERKQLDSLSDASIARIKSAYPNFGQNTPESWIHSPDEKNGKLIAIFQLPTDFQLPTGTTLCSFLNCDIDKIGHDLSKFFTSSHVQV